MKKCFEKLLEILRQNLKGTEIEHHNQSTYDWSKGRKFGQKEIIGMVEEYAEQVKEVCD